MTEIKKLLRKQTLFCEYFEYLLKKYSRISNPKIFRRQIMSDINNNQNKKEQNYNNKQNNNQNKQNNQNKNKDNKQYNDKRNDNQ